MNISLFGNRFHAISGAEIGTRSVFPYDFVRIRRRL